MNFAYPTTVPEAIRAGLHLFKENHAAATIWKFSVVVLAASLGFVLYMLFTEGHASFNTSSDGIIWGLPIVTYAFFVLTSTGLTFVASMAMVFDFKEFYPIAKRCIWLAVVTLLAGFASLALELGHPFRMSWAIPTGMQINSPMFWLGNFYGVYLVFLVLKFRSVSLGDWNSSTSKAFGIIAFVTVGIAYGMSGASFGAMAMRPMWFGPLIPLYFLLTAALAGTVFAILFTYLTYGREQAMPEKVRSLMHGAMPRAFAAVLGIAIVAIISRTGIGLWSNADGLQVWSHVVQTPWFWIEMVFVLVAFARLLMGAGVLVPAVMVIVALLIGRYEFIIGGQMLPPFRGTWSPGLIEYVPSLTEWMIAVMSFAITFAGWALGERLLNLGATPQDRSPDPLLRPELAGVQGQVERSVGT